MENKIPKDFFWGNSTSSMQTEGAWNEGGKDFPFMMWILRGVGLKIGK